MTQIVTRKRWHIKTGGGDLKLGIDQGCLKNEIPGVDYTGQVKTKQNKKQSCFSLFQ